MSPGQRSGFARPTAGREAQLTLDHLPPVPPSIASCDDPLLRRHGSEAWGAASRLRAALRLWASFLVLYRRKVPIDHTSQARVSGLFPSLGDYREVLNSLVGSGG